MDLKITKVAPSYQMTKNHWGRLSTEMEIMKRKIGEGVHYKNVFGSYFHGPILSRNANLAYRLVTTALKKKYGQDIFFTKLTRIFSAKKLLKNTAMLRARLNFYLKF